MVKLLILGIFLLKDYSTGAGALACQAGFGNQGEDDGALVDLLLVTMEADFTQGPCRVERGGLDGPEDAILCLGADPVMKHKQIKEVLSQ